MRNRFLKWYSKYKIHVFAWLFYMLYEALSIGLVFNNFASPIIYFSHYLVFIFFFYLHADVLLPLSLRSKWTIPFMIGIQIMAYIVSQYAVSYLLIVVDVTSNPLQFNHQFILRNAYRAIFYMGFSTGYYFLHTYLRERKKSEELEKAALNAIIAQQKVTQELSNAQNAFLKAQINPHFLFNTLDFVYHNVSMHSAIAGEAIIRLSEMMRFAIDSGQMEDKLLLHEEIEQVENLIYLYKIGKSTNVYIEFTYSEAVKNLRFIPLVLLTLAENIFKHGNLNRPESPATISLAIQNNVFCLRTTNLINNIKSTKNNHSGLSNTYTRLTYAYGTDVVFNCTTKENTFIVEVEVPLQLLKALF